MATRSRTRFAPGPTAKEEKSEMDSLTDAGLLTRLEDRDMHVDRYTLNLAGNRFAPRFCYGHREVTGIVSFTPPGPHNGFTETTVTYQYAMRDVPVWAGTDQAKPRSRSSRSRWEIRRRIRRRWRRWERDGRCRSRASFALRRAPAI